MTSIQYLIDNNYLPSEEILDRIKSYDYGQLDQLYRIKSLHHLSGLQVRNLILRFNFIFGDLKDIHNKMMFEGMSKLSSIIQIVYSSTMNEQNLQALDKFIKSVLTIYKSFFNKHLKPKHHYMLHYVEIIRKLGPLKVNETTPFERKHKFFTRVMEHHTQFRNFLKTCAYHHQIWWADKWQASSIKFPQVQVTGKRWEDPTPLQNIDSIPPGLDLTGLVCKVTSATHLHRYKPLLYVIHNERFHEIEEVVVQNDDIYLVTTKINTNFNTFYAAHEVIGRERFKNFIDVRRLEIKDTFAALKPYHQTTTFILCKKNVLHKY